MSVRRYGPVQPKTFAFTAENLAWCDKLIARYPEGRQASAVIPMLWKAQEQDGWISEASVRWISEHLGMPYIRVYEIVTFYTMFHMAPVGRTHVQVCGTTPCMLRGAGDLIDVCKKRMGPHAKQVTEDGQFSWEEVECLGACVNAPLVQIFSDTYEDLDTNSFNALLDAFARGESPKPGPQIARTFSAPEGGPLTLTEVES